MMSGVMGAGMEGSEGTRFSAPDGRREGGREVRWRARQGGGGLAVAAAPSGGVRARIEAETTRPDSRARTARAITVDTARATRPVARPDVLTPMPVDRHR